MTRTRTLADGVARQDDNFLLLRFLAAALVIYGHAPAITGGSGPVDLFVRLHWGEYSGAIAVDLFFITSGFLVTGSWLRRPHAADFLFHDDSSTELRWTTTWLAVAGLSRT